MKVDISIGELIDKITILSIKLENIKDDEKRNNILKEYNTLLPLVGDEHEPYMWRLKRVNSSLWTIEDMIREKEQKNEFDNAFIQLARSVYKTNDKRAELKRKINVKFKSDLIEEKSYKSY